MDDRDLLAILTGVRTTPIPVGRITPYRARLIGAHTDLVLLSPYTVGKQETKHHDETLALYRIGAASLKSNEGRVDPRNKMNFLFRTLATDRGPAKEYRTTVKANAAGTEIYLVSVHELKKNQWLATVKRTYSEPDWERYTWMEKNEKSDVR